MTFLFYFLLKLFISLINLFNQPRFIKLIEDSSQIHMISEITNIKLFPAKLSLFFKYF